MLDSPISPKSLERQIAREGERWGLTSRYVPENGRTQLVEMTHEAEAHHGLGEVRKGPNWVICTIDDESPMRAAMANRRTNGETDIAQRYRAERRMSEQINEAAHNARDAEARRLWADRKKIRVLPTGIVPAGLVERARLNRSR